MYQLSEAESFTSSFHRSCFVFLLGMMMMLGMQSLDRSIHMIVHGLLQVGDEKACDACEYTERRCDNVDNPDGIGKGLPQCS